MIHAKDALEITKKYKSLSDFIEEQIEKSAEEGSDYVVIDVEPYCYWFTEGYKMSNTELQIVKRLKENGFNIKHREVPPNLELMIATRVGLCIYWGTLQW